MDETKPVIRMDDQDDTWDYYDECTDPSSLDSKRISEVIISSGWEKYTSECVTPDSHHLDTYDLICSFKESINRDENPPKRTQRTFLVLDNYGNDWLSEAMDNRLIGFSEPYTIAIDKETGSIYVVTFKRIKLHTVDAQLANGAEQYAAFISEFPLYNEDSFVVPEQYLTRLDELKHFKRPFRVTVDTYWLLQFYEREASWGDLQERLVVDLEFDCEERGVRAYLEVGKQIWREVSSWRDIPQEYDDEDDDDGNDFSE